MSKNEYDCRFMYVACQLSGINIEVVHILLLPTVNEMKKNCHFALFMALMLCANVCVFQKVIPI